MFTLSQIQPQLKLADELDRLREENARLRETLRRLSNEASGLIHAHEFALSMDGGNSNMQTLRIRLEEALAALEGKDNVPL